jgi:hypothetical protein
MIIRINSINKLNFVVVSRWVFFAVRTVFLNII